MAILQTNDIFKTELSEGQHRLSPEEIHKVQQVVYGITIDITELCSELNIPYMLTGGTALGAVRHGGFIPWDDDVDMVVERKYIERLLDAIEQRYPDRYFVEAPLRTPGYLSSFIQIHRKNTVCREYLEIPEERCGIKIDIFVVENRIKSVITINIINTNHRNNEHQKSKTDRFDSHLSSWDRIRDRMVTIHPCKRYRP